MAITAPPPDETEFGSIDEPAHQSGSSDDSIETYLTTARRRWRLLAAVGAAVALITGVVTYLTPRKYRATATFIAAEEPSGQLGGKSGSSIVGMASMLGMSGMPGLSSLTGGTKSPEFYGALLTSKDVLDSIVVTHYHSSQPDGFNGDLVKYFKIKKPTRSEQEFAALVKLKKRLMEVTVDEKTEMVAFTVTTTDPDLSAQIARTLLDKVNDFNLKHRQSSAGAERAFTEQRKTEALADLDKAEQTLADWDMRNRSVNQSPLLLTERQGLQRRIEIAEQTYMELVQSYEEARIEEVRNTPVITVVDNPERLIEPIPRDTILKMLVAGVVTALGTLMFVISAERRRARRRRPRPVVDEWSEPSGV